jgi:hypothetical protein
MEINDRDSRFGGRFLAVAQHIAHDLEDGKGAGEIQLGRLFLGVLLIEDDLLAEFVAKHFFEILTMFDGIDDPGSLGFFGCVGPLVDPVLSLGDVNLAARRDQLQIGRVHAVQKPILHLLGFFAGAFAKVHFCGTLVVAAGEKIGFHAQEIEQAAQVGGFAVQAEDPQVGGRHHAESADAR